MPPGAAHADQEPWKSPSPRGCADRRDLGQAAAAFAQEVRRFYPIAPFVGAFAVKDLTWRGEPISEGTLVLLDLYGQNPDGDLWARPYSFRPGRFIGASRTRRSRAPGRRGSGDLTPVSGEAVTVALLRTPAVRLARLDHMVPGQDPTISLRRVPTRPRGGFVITDVRGGGAERKGEFATSGDTVRSAS